MTTQEMLAAAMAVARSDPNTKTLEQLEAARDVLQAALSEAEQAENWREADAIDIQLNKILFYIRHRS